jgi:hypothetical protein
VVFCSAIIPSPFQLRRADLLINRISLHELVVTADPLNRPFVQPTISSAYCTEMMRWAMTMTVVPRRFSGRTADFGLGGRVHRAGGVVQNEDGRFFSMARAMHSRCFCPPETLTPPCSM